LLDVMGGAARSANRINLHGHTDAFVASETGTELAIRRAVEVRRLLISLTSTRNGSGSSTGARPPDTAVTEPKSVMAVGGALRCDRALCDRPAHFANDGIKTGTTNRT
jgi:hypothetical protein